MKFVKGNAVVGQSGGPTSAINATLAGVFKGAKDAECINTVYGMVHGIAGLLNRDLVDMSTQVKNDEDLAVLKATPSAFLGSCRYKLPALGEGKDIYDKIFEIFAEYDIKYFFYIGGNDSMDTVHKLSEYAAQINYEINIIGVPKTIDNDLAVTDHTPGYGSAAKYIATAVREIIRDAVVYDKPMFTVMEIMGRNAGWLTAASALARVDGFDGPDFIYLPERLFDMDKFVADVCELAKTKPHITVAVSEGIKSDENTYVCEAAIKNAATDSFGHKSLSGTANYLAQVIGDKLGIKTRAVEFSLLQRCAAHCGSETDIEESFAIAQAAVREAVSGGTGKMMYYKREEGAEYKVSFDSMDISKIANVERVVPDEWINAEGNNVNDGFIDYALPLIQGEAPVYTKNGIPTHLVLNK